MEAKALWWCDMVSLLMLLQGQGCMWGLGMSPEDAFGFHLLKQTTDPCSFSPQLLLGEEYVCFLLEHPEAEIRPLRVCSAAANFEHPL